MRPTRSGFAALSIFFCATFYNPVHSFQVSQRLSTSTWANSNSNYRPPIQRNTVLYVEKTKGKTKGVYVRPSAAIERGSGFYVPGLEGSRVRIIFGALCLILSYVNSVLGLGDSNIAAVEFSQKLVGFYGILLLFQGLVEYGKEAGLGLDFDVSESRDENVVASSSNAKSLDQIVASGLEERLLEKIRWAAASFVSLTPAVQVMLLESDSDENGNQEVLYSLGSASFQKNDDLNQAIYAAVDTVSNSKGGRVSVPDTHPCATLLPEESRRCILLQKVESSICGDNVRRRHCLMVGSNQLLAAFTKNDLKWLGSLSNSLN